MSVIRFAKMKTHHYCVLSAVLGLFVLWLGYCLWSRETPGSYLRSARKAQANGQWQEAELYLRNVLRDRPHDGPAHRELAEVYLRQAKAQTRRASYATDSRALYHLDQAGQLCPEDLPLQKELLNVYLSRRELPEAKEVAERITARQPDDVAALLLEGWAALNRRDAKQTEAWFNRLAAGLNPAQLQPLSREELVMLCDQLLKAVEQAPDQATAERRAEKALNVYQTLATGRRLDVGGLASRAARIMLSLAVQWKPAGKKGRTEARLMLADLDRQAESLRAAAIAAGADEPLVCAQAASAALARGDREGALEIARRGLAAAAAIPTPADKTKTAPSDSVRPPGVLDMHLLLAQQLVQLRRYAEAEEHVNALVRQKESAGWGHLLAGWVALAQGQADKALGHYTRAQYVVGVTPPVRMGLAKTHLVLRQWGPALEQLQALERAFPRLSPEDRAWAAQFFGEGIEWIRFYQLHAELARGGWQEAERHCAALRGTSLGPKAEMAMVGYFWAAGQQQAAISRLAEARRHHPHDPRLLAAELAVLQRQGKISEAQRQVDAFAETAPHDDLQGVLLVCHWRRNHGQLQQAWDHLSAAEPKLPTTPEQKAALAVIKAELLLGLGRPEEAVSLIEPLCSDPQMATAAGLIVAAAQVRLDHPEKAAQAVATAREIHPDSPVLNHLQGELAAATGDYSQAIELLAPSLEAEGLRSRAAEVLAPVIRELARQEPPADVQKQVDRLLAKAPDEPALLVVKAELQLQQGQTDAAEALFEQLERQLPQDAQVAALRASAWLRANQVSRALEEAQRGLKLDPRHAACLLAAAQASLAADRPQEAHDHAVAAVQQNPRLVSAAWVRVQALRRLGRQDEAIGALEELTHNQPRMVEAHLALGQALAAAGRVDEALEAYRNGSANLPGNTSLIAAQVGLMSATGRLEEASRVASMAAETNPTAAICLILGDAFDAAKQFPAAQAYYRRALELADQQQKQTAHLLLGNSLLRQHQDQASPELLAQARDHFAAVVQADPANVLAANNLAWLLAKEFKQADEAARVIDNAQLRTDSGHLPASIAHTVAVVYRAAGRADDARRVLAKALVWRPDEPKLWRELAAVLADDGWREATSALDRALPRGLLEFQAN